jgi:peptidoglycan/LPS O-acetylase OafA/YrhL
VVLGHVAYTFSDRLGDLSRNRSAVDVFIILSGFVITNLLVRGREGYRTFLLRRFFRIFPVYWIALLLSAAALPIAIYAFGHSPFHTGRDTVRVANALSASKNLWAQLAVHLPLLQGLAPSSLVPDANIGIVGQAWSLSVEWQFYLIAPLVVWALLRGWIWRVLTIAAAAGVEAISPVILKDNTAFIGPSLHWFAVGIASYFLWTHRTRPVARLLTVGLALALIGDALVMRQPAPIVWAVVLVGLIWQIKLVSDVLGSPLLRHLGQSSYSVYLIHILPLTFCLWLVDVIHPARPIAILALATTIPAATYIMAQASFRFIEAPGMALGRRVAARLQAPGPAARQALPAS